MCRFLLPASLIVINDIMAYFFGVFFGKTPLIKLSPKKTWEGFIGASFSTVLSAFTVFYLDLWICAGLCWSGIIVIQWDVRNTSVWDLFLCRLLIFGSLSVECQQSYWAHRMSRWNDHKIALCLQLAYVMGQSEWLTCPRKVRTVITFWITFRSIRHCSVPIYLFSWNLKVCHISSLWW